MAVVGTTVQSPEPTLRVNGVLCPSPTRDEGFAFEFAVPPEALADECHVLEIDSADRAALTVVRVELAVS